MIKKILYLFIGVFITTLTWCKQISLPLNSKQEIVNTEKTYQYRQISRNELQKFIPYWYSIVKPNDNQNWDEWVIYFSGDTNENKDILLFINWDWDPQWFRWWEIGVKLLLLNFSNKDDTWNIRDTLILSWDKWISSFFSNGITDLDSNWIDEIFLKTEIIWGSDSAIVPHIITVKNDKLIDLIGSYDIWVMAWIWGNIINHLNDEDPNIILINWIRWENESHFWCHYYSVKTYKYVNEWLTLLSELKTKNRYTLDVPDGFCITIQPGKFDLYDNLNDYVLKDVWLK